MATVRPFKAVRPRRELAAMVAALPYDVMNTDEARQMAAGNPYSFLRVDKAEIDLPPEIDQYDPAVYARANENLQVLIRDAMQQDDTPNLYIYRLTGYGQCQTGLVACVSAAEYERGEIKRHEFTRPDKEADRVRHAEATEAHTSPIFLAYRDPSVADSPKKLMAKCVHAPAEYDFTAEDGVRHEIWVISDTSTKDALIAAFAKIPALYIADGHHRNATAAIVAKKRNEATIAAGKPLDLGAEHNFYLAAIFPHDELAILDYNRVVKDLNGLSHAEFLQKLTNEWNVEKSTTPVKPSRKLEIGMYLREAPSASDSGWYRLTIKKPPASADPIENLDCSVLQNSLLAPILGIGDPRTDKRIDFVGGIRGIEGLEARVNSGEMAVAFALFATSMDELMSVADANQIMPPKSTWFEPKLRCGLLVHLF